MVGRRWNASNKPAASVVVNSRSTTLSEAIKCFYNTSWWVKMVTLIIALLFTLTVRERALRNEALDTSTRSRLIGAASIAL